MIATESTSTQVIKSVPIGCFLKFMSAGARFSQYIGVFSMSTGSKLTLSCEVLKYDYLVYLFQ